MGDWKFVLECISMGIIGDGCSRRQCLRSIAATSSIRVRLATIAAKQIRHATKPVLAIDQGQCSLHNRWDVVCVVPAAHVDGTVERVLCCMLATFGGCIAVGRAAIAAMLLGETADARLAAAADFARVVDVTERILLG